MAEQRLFYDTIPEIYDSARPGYPEPLADDISTLCALSLAARVLDVGCGTGKATELWARRGYRVTALDIGAHLLAFCQRKLCSHANVTYVHSSFEDWQAGTERYDLVTAATAFHWVGPTGLAKARSLLTPAGHVAIFWHTYLNSDDPFYRKLDDVYRVHAPHLYQDGFQAEQELCERQKEEALFATDGFTSHRILRYYQHIRYGAAGYGALLRTFSTHTTLAESFYDALASAIREVGGAIVKPIRTTVWIAKSIA